MKLFKTIAAIALVAITAPTASAQFSNGVATNRNAASSNMSAYQPTDYNRIQLSYDNTAFTGHKGYKKWFNGETTLSTNGVGFSYIHGFKVSKTLPMYIETGAKLTALFGSVTQEGDYDEEYTTSAQYIHLSVPVNYSYKFIINNNFAVSPYVGLDFKLYVLGRFKNSYTDEYGDEEDGDWINFFSDDEEDGMRDEDATWNRFQLGWHVGVGFDIKKFYIGLQYGTDFIPATKYKKHSITTGNFALNVGINF